MELNLPDGLRLYQPGDIGGVIEPLDPVAYRGPIGAFVDRIGPETEAPEEALGAGLMAGVSAYLGRGVYYEHGRIRHYPNLLVAQVGDTSVTRKGTTQLEIHRFLRAVDKRFVENNIASGIASGQVLIKKVSDPVYDKDNELKSGTEDQRLFLSYGELSALLRSADRSGVLLSETLRLAFDNAILENEAMSSGSYRSSNASIAVYGATTESELITLAASDAATSGFFNRVCWLHSTSDKLLPRGGAEVEYNDMAGRLRANASKARQQRRFPLSPEAADMWDEVYPRLKLGSDLPPEVRPLLARRADHVSRIALIFAVTEEASEIGTPQLTAALAWVEYFTQTVQAILGGLVRDPLAGQLLEALRSHPGVPVNRSELHGVFGRNQTGTAIEASLSALVRAGLAFTWTGEASEGGGPRPHLAIATTPIREELGEAA